MKTDALGVVLASGNVLRCHTMPCLHRQTIGQHTWRAMIILHWLFHPAYPPPQVSYAMLMHDVPEIHTGDVPGGIKADHAGLSVALDELEQDFLQSMGIPVPMLPPLEERLVKVCDRADLTLYTLDEYEMGNVHMETIARRAYQMTTRLINDSAELRIHWPRVVDLAAALDHRIGVLRG
ncbi:MAG: HD domain-containing protein [Candidatus Hydrogenedentes bacterium]|nr:HD domain-containing protein [Candidatus Hydrogenedentota bacterium]